MAYVNNGMSFDYVVKTMKFLGYITHDEKGGLTVATMATARALTGRPEHCMTASDIATEYAKHNPEFMRGTPSHVDRKYCSACGEVYPCGHQHLPNHVDARAV